MIQIVFLGKAVELGWQWLQNFLVRWKSESKVIKEEKIETSRRNGFTEGVRRGWFEKLRHMLLVNNLMTRPHAIFNCDESGFSDETACKFESFFKILFRSSSNTQK